MKLKHEKNWGGGSFTLDGKEVQLKPFKIKIEDNLILVVKEVSGVDYDHGHSNSWSNYSIHLITILHEYVFCTDALPEFNLTEDQVKNLVSAKLIKY